MKSVWHMIYLDIFEYLKNRIILNSSKNSKGTLIRQGKKIKSMDLITLN